MNSGFWMAQKRFLKFQKLFALSKLKEPFGLYTIHPALSVVLIWCAANGSFQRFTPDRIGDEHAEFRTSVEAALLNVISGNVSVRRLDRWSKRENAQRTTMAEGVVNRIRRHTSITIVVNVIDASLTLERKPIG